MPGDQNHSPWRRPIRHNEANRNGDFADLIQMAAVLSTVQTSSKNKEKIDKDGSISTGSRDPPGQSSIYIPPGDHWVESYRLSTFSNWSADTPVSKNDLATCGFYYTGFQDRVKCFSCGVAVDNWVIGDKGTDPKWHKSDCAMAAGQDESNIPLSTTKIKNTFRGIFQSTFSASTSLASSCASQQQCSTSQQAGVNQGWIDASPLKPNATGRSNSSQQTYYPPFTLGDVHSPEHERLLYSLDLRKESDRRKTFNKWPSYPAPDLASKLAEEGFIYLGNLDRTQCFSCSGVLRNWARDDNPRTEHARHFPDCRIVMGLETRNIPLSSSEKRALDEEERHRRVALFDNPPVEPPDPPMEEKLFLARRFPCLNPINPGMDDLTSRIETFSHSSWPAQKIRARPEEIAKAGFFYLGQGDRTKCFYCNGGLQNWEANDEPWTEHAKWFPGCEFIIRQKGTRLVKELVEAHPNLSRPPIRNPVSYDVQYIPPFPISTSTVTAAVTRPAIASRTVTPASISVADTLQNLLSEKTCKRCYKEDANHVTQPCGHIALCSNCVGMIHNCPICKVKIVSTIKIYRT